MHRRPILGCAAALAALAVPLAGCGGGPSSTTTTNGTSSSSSSTTATQRAAVILTFTRSDGTLGNALRSVPIGTGSAAAPRAALHALITGPDSTEQAAGLSTDVPGSTTIGSLTVDNGQALLDLGSDFVTATTAAGPTALPTAVAQIVFTLTQFASVQQVAFRVDGAEPSSADEAAGLPAQPVSRTNEFAHLPPIFVEQPAVGGSVSAGKLRIEGLADVFEAQFRVQLEDASGAVVVDQPVHASAGSGTWGEFDVTVPYTTARAGMGKLIVFALSAKDGSRVDEVDIPLAVTP
ncbi:MAG: Gmad2 immunoglobulin-like domain-containing protein [Acidimicrobiales bacterium]